MGKKIFIYIFLLVPTFCASCDEFEESDTIKNKEVISSEVTSDSVGQNQIEQDSLKQGQVSKVDTQITEILATKKEVEQLQSEIKDLKSPDNFIALLAFLSLLLAIVAIIMSIIRTNKKINKWEAKDMTKQIVREQINDLEYRMTRAEKAIKEIDKSLASPSKSSMSNGTFDKKLMELELRMNRIEGSCNAASSNHHSVVIHSSIESEKTQEPAFLRIGYAKVDTDMYFTTIFESNQEGCVFKITFTSQSKGKFNIISLDKIRSRNDWQKKVECKGVSIKEASDFRLEEEGICEKIDEINWKVTKPLKILLLK